MKKYFKLLFLLICFILFLFLGDFFRRGMSYCTYPFISIGWHIRNIFRKIIDNSHEQDILYKDYLSLQLKYNELKSIVSIYGYIDTMLSLYKQYMPDCSCYNYNFLPARILLVKNNNNEKTFFINRGFHDGIKEGMPIVQDFFLLGKVNKVYPLYSEVISTVDTRAKISFIIEKTDVKGVAQGCGAENLLQAIYVSNGGCVKPGMKIYSLGEGLVYPPGFIIGNVEKVISHNGIDYTILISLDYNIKDFLYCSVLVERNNFEELNRPLIDWHQMVQKHVEDIPERMKNLGKECNMELKNCNNHNKELAVAVSSQEQIVKDRLKDDTLKKNYKKNLFVDDSNKQNHLEFDCDEECHKKLLDQVDNKDLLSKFDKQENVEKNDQNISSAHEYYQEELVNNLDRDQTEKQQEDDFVDNSELRSIDL
jgi:cell shape-determining protein MreC